MEHKEYRKLVPGATTAVLFIHGIVGTPNHFLTRIPLVERVPEKWSVCNVLLPGHGADADAFAASTMKTWKSHVRTVFDELAQTHERVIVVGHSMGTLFAIQLAVRDPERVPFLYLLAVPMIPGVKLRFVMSSLRLVFGKIRENRPPEAALREACGAKTTRKLWKYCKWIPRFLELLREIAITQKQMPELRVPAIAWQSGKDELVTSLSRRVLEKFRIVDIRVLPDSTHFYYAPDDRERILLDFRERCEKYVQKQD